MKKQLSVLCIDDDEAIGYALSQLCESQGWRPFTAAEVEDGLRIRKTRECGTRLAYGEARLLQCRQLHPYYKGG